MADISIITAAFNAEVTIENCLSSVQNQQNVSVEHIVVDGGSRDRTVEIARRIGNVSLLISEPDDGIYDAMNKGVGLATGEIVGILNADDFYTDELVLSTVVRSFSDPEVDACYGDLVYIAKGNESHQSKSYGTTPQNFKVLRYWKSGAFDPRKFYWGWMPPHPAFFVRRSVMKSMECSTWGSARLLIMKLCCGFCSSTS